jgi:hypothetical protein
VCFAVCALFQGARFDARGAEEGAQGGLSPPTR